MNKFYYARFTEECEGGYSIDFPSIEGAYTEGDTVEEGLLMAEDCLSLHLGGLLDDGEAIPKQPKQEEIKLEDNQKLFKVVVNQSRIEEIIKKY